MQLIKTWLLLTTFFLSSFVIANNQQVYFEPKLVKLNGVVTMLTFPGAPNYESIKNGDTKETGAYLVLDKPLDIQVSSNAKMDNDEPRKNVKVLQLIVLNDSDWNKLEEGYYVNITGTLSSALTGHHHTWVLLEINKIKVLSKQSNRLHKPKVDINDVQQFLIH